LPVLKHQVYLAIYFGVSKLVSVFNSRQRWALLLKTGLKRDENGIKICILASSNVFEPICYVALPTECSADRTHVAQLPATPEQKNRIVYPNSQGGLKTSSQKKIVQGLSTGPNGTMLP